MAAPKGVRKIKILRSMMPIDRADGTSYVARRDDVVIVSADAASRLVDGGLAELVGARKSAKAAPAEVAPETRPGDGADDSESKVEADESGQSEELDGEDQDSEDETQPEEVVAVEKPAKTAPVAAWREYALTQGADADEVAETSRADLITLYG